MLSSPEIWREFFETYYQDELNKLADKFLSHDSARSIHVDFLNDLVIFKEGKLAEELLEYPDIVLEHANQGLELADNIHDVKLVGCKARFYNLPLSRRVLIRDLRSEHISKFVAIEGIVRKVTEVRPRIVEATFVCSTCGKKVRVPQEENTIKQPYECKACKSKSRFILLPEESISIDSQRIKIQEYPENLKGGEQPQTIDVLLEGDLTGKINPGDRVVINGIVRAQPRAMGSKKLLHMDIHLEGNSIEILQQEYEEFEITEEDKKKIVELSEDPDIYNKIVRSIAPSIYGHEDIKMAIALQLFGGVPKRLPDGTEIRGDIHILLVGDPGVAKSQLLRYVHRIAPRSVYTTGKGTTTAGLCVAPDSIIFTENSVFELGKLVDSTQLTEFRKGIYTSTPERPIKVQTINPTKVTFKPSNTLWKLKSPEKLIKIKTQSGKEIITTPETKILVLENGEIKWKKAKDLKHELIATARELKCKGRKVLTIELIKDLDITVYGVKSLVKELIETIKTKKGLTTRELAKKLDVNEDSLYYSWINENAVGNINLKTLIKLAEEAEYDLEKVAEKIESFSQYHGHKIKLPKYLDEKFLYFAGLIAGDGDITRTPRGGYVIRFSNGDEELRRKFKKIVKDFGFEVEEESEGWRTPSIRFSSKIVAHILNKLGIPVSPKSHALDMSEILLSLPDKELSAYIRGLFDCDGTVVIRKNGSSFIEFDTTSEKLAKKLQLALLRFGIISYLRKRECKGEISKVTLDNGDEREIVKKHDRYELKIYRENAKKFAKLIGFEHPEKSRKLQRLLEIKGKEHTNFDVIPDVGKIIKEIRMFYGLSINETYGSNFGQLVESGKRHISRKVLQRVVENLKTKANIEMIKVKIPEEIKYEIGVTLKPEELNLNKTLFYEYFKRKGRTVRVPFKVLTDVAEKLKDQNVHDKITKILNELKAQEKLVAEKLEYLENLAYSDILWERIKEKQEIESPYEYVYDLTVENSHSFIANGIVVHNTATATRDEYDGRWTLEAGALVLADKGIALVDEIDKMRSEDRSALHEAMEQQTVSVAKAGINAVLRARCALLGAANPKYGRFDRYAPIAEQIDLSPTLLSRFDLIFVLTDDPDEERDRLLAKHILDTHALGEKLEKLKNIVSTEYNREAVESEAKKIEPAIEPELLRKYIAYAKRTVFPVLTEEAKERITNFYLSLRSKAKENSPMPVTARQLEALIRLAEASARLRLSDQITLEDVERVIRIVRKSLEQIAIDPETGEIDIDYAFTGTSKTQRDRIMTMKRIVEELENIHEKGAPEEEILKMAEEHGINPEKAKEILYKMKERGDLYCPRVGFFRVVRKD